VLIAGALRPRQAPRRLAEALAGEVVYVEPAALDLESARALLSDALDDSDVRALHRESGGVPFYLQELARAPQGAPARPASAELAGSELPRAVALALQGELESLPGPAGALLRAAAVAGDPFELHLATAAAGLAEEDSLVSLDELVERDLVRATAVPRRLAFRHALVRHAVYQSASPSFRIAAHGRAAAALEAADEARAAWFAHTAGTRDNAHRARAELKARGVDLDDPDDRTTAEEWLAAHRAEQLEADADREVHDEHELADHDRGEPELPAADDAAETAVPDVRDTSTPDVTEAADPTDRHRVLTADETAAAVARAQAALAEIAARADADAARAARDAEDANRREELARWAADDRAAAAAAARDREDDLVRER